MHAVAAVDAPVRVVQYKQPGYTATITQAKWLPLNEGVVVAFNDGCVRTYNFEVLHAGDVNAECYCVIAATQAAC